MKKGYGHYKTKYEGIDKSGWSALCYDYQHKACKNKQGRCTCSCHTKEASGST